MIIKWPVIFQVFFPNIPFIHDLHPIQAYYPAQQNHGGLSTGPKSDAGKERIRQAQMKRWSEYRA